MLLFPGTETSDDREFTVYKKERCNPPVRKTERNTFIIQSITSIIIGRQFTVPALRCPDELVGSCLNSYKRRCIPSSSCGVNGTLGPGPVPRLGSGSLESRPLRGPVALMASGGLRITGMVAALSCTIIRAVRLLNSLQRFQL
jgi:hypothetical protein